jgi:four helix bundle protein
LALGFLDGRAVLGRVKDACGAALRAVASQSLTRPVRGAGGVGARLGRRAQGGSMLRIYDDAIAVIGMLRPVMVQIGRHDSDLMRQLRRCSASMALNIAEGSYARAGNQKALFGVALGSAKETRACIDVANALGYVGAIDAQIEDRLEKIGGVLYRLAHR